MLPISINCMWVANCDQLNFNLQNWNDGTQSKGRTVEFEIETWNSLKTLSETFGRNTAENVLREQIKNHL